MNRLRTTFTRSRTPTGAEMKTQNSLEVPKQVRSASFDEMQLEGQRGSTHLLKQQSSSSTDDRSEAAHLQVPQASSQRSHSFDSAVSAASAGSDDSGAFLDVPRRLKQRRASSTKTPPPCIHCLYLEEYERRNADSQPIYFDPYELKSLSYSSSETEEDFLQDVADDDEDEDDEASGGAHSVISEDEGVDDDGPHFGNALLPPQPSTPCNIVFTLSPTTTAFPVGSPPASPLLELPPLSPTIDFEACEPLLMPPPSSPSIELSLPPTTIEPDQEDDSGEPVPPYNRARRRSISRQEAVFVEPKGNSLENVNKEEEPLDTPDSKKQPSVELCTLGVRDIYLAVPDLKRDRAASVDSCFSKVSSGGKTEEVQPNDGCYLDVPNISARSRSVDIVLPTAEQARYKALALSGSVGAYGKTSGSGGGKRGIRIVPDWTENAVQGEHYWKATSASGDYCSAGNECRKSGNRMKCSACQLIAHVNCVPTVNNKTELACKPTYREVGVRQYRQDAITQHHWVHRRTEKNKCTQCGKTAAGKLFGGKDIVAIACAWCKNVYHNKESCFDQKRIGEQCSLGEHAKIVVPPSWIVKLPSKGSFKSSIRTPKRTRPINNKKNNVKQQSKDPKDQKEQKAFIIKPIPTSDITPVIVFINPKSGGNQGVKLLGKFQWLLNPRQVFDLTQGGPKMGLELFRKAPNLRILACGGDGTVGWVLSVLDQINIQPPPAVGVLPLGTGNDLARALGWGGGYTDEPVSKILHDIGQSDSVLLDRWRLKIQPNEDAEKADTGKDNLPLNVINNYFSFGVDAHIALEFHEAREAHPEKFNSRLRNKMFYGQMGGKDLLLRKYRNLSDITKLECDGEDYTYKLQEYRVHAILFLNIDSYGGGTHPWNNSSSNILPSTEDGLIEVVGLTTYRLPMLQAGAHGISICQCKTAKITTYKTLPMQVDGEACRVKPSIIEIELLNKAVLLAKKKKGRVGVQMGGIEPQNLNVMRITLPNYEHYHNDKDLVKGSATKVGEIQIVPTADLRNVRETIKKLLDQDQDANYPRIGDDWVFVDSITADVLFRIDREQEQHHYVIDITSDDIYVLDEELETIPQSPEGDLRSTTFTEYGHQYEMDRQRSERFLRNPTKQSQENLSTSTRRKDDMNKGLGPNANTGNRNQVQRKPFQPKSGLLEKTSDAILLAAKRGNLIWLRCLHEQGYSLLSLDAVGQTGLHYASEYNHKDIVRFFIVYAPWEIINMAEKKNGYTALHVAVKNNRRDISVMLVAAGANLTIRDNDGNTPMMIAFNNNAKELAAYLESQERFLRMDLEDKI